VTFALERLRAFAVNAGDDQRVHETYAVEPNEGCGKRGWITWLSVNKVLW
jgi:hypothetical protein